MMSLTKVSLFNVTKTQYRYKLKAYFGLFTALATYQIIAGLLSQGGMGSAHTDIGTTTFTITMFSNSSVVGTTFIYAFYVSILLTTRDYRNEDAMFVSNRLSSNLANGALLFTFCLAGGLFAVLAGALLRLLVFLYTGGGIASPNFFLTPAELVVGFAVTTLYLLLFSAAGYLCGVLVQYSKAFVVILPSLFLGLLFLAARDAGIRERLSTVINFVAQESSLTLLALKIILLAAMLFGSALLISNRSEVRK